MDRFATPLVSVARAAELLSVSPKTIRRKLESRELDGHRIGNVVRVDLSRFTAMPRPEASPLPEERHMLTDERGLAGPLKYTAEQTGVIAGLRVPLGTADRVEALARLEQARARYAKLSREGRSASDYSAVAIKSNGAITHVKFRPQPEVERIMRRVPTELSRQLETEADIERFCLAYVATHDGTVSSPGTLDKDLAALTWDELAKSWFNGELRKKYPEYVKEKKTVRDDEIRYQKYVAPVVGNRLVTEFLGEAVHEACDELVRHMRETSPDLAATTRRHVLQLFRRMLSLAVFPLRLLSRNDFPRQRMPKATKQKAFSYLYPDEDRVLLSCSTVALHHRLYLGILAREGLRASELRDLEWSNLDLERGLLRLDESKTESPRVWVLDFGVLEALRRWQGLLSDKARRSPYVVVDRKSGRRIAGGHASSQLRAALKRAEVKRASLFADTESRIAIRGHDLRATFVTLALAAGKTEAWVTDRTGHTSSTMLYRYKRAARTHAEAQLGELTPLHEAIPELAKLAESRAE